MTIQIALCAIPPIHARQIAAWFEEHDGLGLRVNGTVDSADALFDQLSTHPAHGVVLDGGLGLEGVSLAQELLAAGYPAVCLAGTADRPHLRQRAGELSIALSPDYQPARLAAQLRRMLGLADGEAAEGQVITCYSPRGGAGTSTLLLSLAQLLNSRGRNVAIVEVGGGGSAIPMLGLRPGGGWADLLPAAKGLATNPDGVRLLTQALVEVQPGLHLLASGGPTIMDEVGADEVEAVLHLLPACGFAYILVDTGAEVSLATAAALAAAHRLCLIALPDPVSAYRLAQLQDLLTGLRIPGDRVFPVINRVRESVPQRLSEVVGFLGYRPAITFSEETKPLVDQGGRFAGFRPGGGAARALHALLDAMALEVSPV